MPADKKDLAAALLASLAPHLTDVAADEQSLPKGILKTMRHLAEQILRARAKQAKRVAKAAAKAAPRNARQQLTGELLTALQQQVGDEQLPGKKTAKLLTKTAEDLAGKVTKLRAKRPQAVTEEPAPAATPRATRTAAPRAPRPTTPRAKRSQPKPAADPDVTA